MQRGERAPLAWIDVQAYAYAVHVAVAKRAAGCDDHAAERHRAKASDLCELVDRTFWLGIDVDRFRTTRSILDGASLPTIVHPARLLPWKGVHTSVAMLAELRRRGIEARLVVTDTARIADWHHQLDAYRKRVLELIDQLGVADLVQLQPVAYRDMPALYEQADVVIYPTIADEPYGLVPLEGMSAGRPVIASRCGGIVETVVDGVTGFLVTPDNPSELADRVASVLTDPQRARAMGTAGRHRVTTDFRLDTYVSRMLESYRSVSAPAH